MAKITITTEIFIARAKEVHGDRYDYSQTVYTPGHKPTVKIRCLEHGEFEQRYDQHLSGKGCSECGKLLSQEIHKNRRSSKEAFIEKAKLVHGDKYDYSKVDYINARTRIEIVCKKHGSFLVFPSQHLLRGKGVNCRKCSVEMQTENKKLTHEEFMYRAVKAGTGLDLTKIVYINKNTDIVLSCKKHGEFTKKPYGLIHGKNGCPKCKNIDSKPELEIKAFIESLGLHTQTITIERKQVDIYIPSLKIGIEFDGLYWHSETKGKSKEYHINKTRLCEDNGVRLIHIFEDEWLNKPELVKLKLKHILGCAEAIKVGARKLHLKQVDTDVANQFCQDYHIQGACKSSTQLGLYLGEVLVALATFGRARFNNSDTSELIRYVTHPSYVVQGGLSRLASNYLENYATEGRLISYCDLRWSVGKAYSASGFKLIGITKPGYFWCRNGFRYGRYSFMKSKLKTRLKTFDPNLTEEQNCLNNGYTKIYDCGHQVWCFEPS